MTDITIPEHTCLPVVQVATFCEAELVLVTLYTGQVTLNAPLTVGVEVGRRVGCGVGEPGRMVGRGVGFTEGALDGRRVGMGVGCPGRKVGLDVGGAAAMLRE